jgi:hypothetical protein
MSYETLCKTAEYLEDRARRARRRDNHERLTAVAKKYRLRAEVKRKREKAVGLPRERPWDRSPIGSTADEPDQARIFAPFAGTEGYNLLPLDDCLYALQATIHGAPASTPVTNVSGRVIRQFRLLRSPSL